MTRKLPLGTLRKMMASPDVPEEDLRPYLTVDRGRSHAFAPTVVPDARTVDIDEAETRAESALGFGNALSRWRRTQRFNRRLLRGDRSPVVVSEGDSWFQFPFLVTDVIDHLTVHYNILSLGAAGDTAENMVAGGEYLDALRDNADRVEAFLFSAAGNDVIGEDENGVPVIKNLVKRRRGNESAAELIDQRAFAATLERLTGFYTSVVRRVRAVAGLERLPIVVHGYDYAFPGSGSDPRDPVWAAPDRWLGGPLSERNITDPTLQREIVRLLIDALYGMLERLARDHDDVHIVDVRGTLARRTDWVDEIHGTDDGFGDVAARFRVAIEAARQAAARRPRTRVELAVAATAAPVAVERPIPSPKLSRPPHTGPQLRTESAGIPDAARFMDGWRTFRRREAGVPTRVEAIIGIDNSLPANFLPKGALAASAVCKIHASGIDYLGRPGAWIGTGFLVAPGILCTNNHVLNTIEVARTARAQFDYELDVDGTLMGGTMYELAPDELFVTSPVRGGLDYTFVRILGDPHAERSLIAMRRAMFVAEEGERANVIHHPAGKPKRVSLQDNRILQFDPVMLHYASDTEGGSSGSPVFDNTWRLIALHHAWQHLPPGEVSPDGSDGRVINEGIKFSAIAVDLERRLADPEEATAARAVLAHIEGSDSATGFFGAAGRRVAAATPLEAVVDIYNADPQDIDVGFWNVEWFNRRYRERVEDVARIVTDLNLDVLALIETSPQATEVLVKTLRQVFGQDYEFAASEPDAPSGRQTTTVIWNPRTVSGERQEWPAEIVELLEADSRDQLDLRFEAVDGKIFNRFPGLFRFAALNRGAGQAPFDFNLVPLHLKAKAEGAKRRRLAAKVLSAAVQRMIEAHGADHDWLIGGDINAELSTGQFDALASSGFLPMSAEDEADGAISYLKGPKSLIDSIFLSPNLARTFGADDFFIYAGDAGIPDFVGSISDHRPVLARLSLDDVPSPASARGRATAASVDQLKRSALGADTGAQGGSAALDEEAIDALIALLRDDPERFLRALSDRLKAC